MRERVRERGARRTERGERSEESGARRQTTTCTQRERKEEETTRGKREEGEQQVKQPVLRGEPHRHDKATGIGGEKVNGGVNSEHTADFARVDFIWVP